MEIQLNSPVEIVVYPNVKTVFKSVVFLGSPEPPIQVKDYNEIIHAAVDILDKRKEAASFWLQPLNGYWPVCVNINGNLFTVRFSNICYSRLGVELCTGRNFEKRK